MCVVGCEGQGRLRVATAGAHRPALLQAVGRGAGAAAALSRRQATPGCRPRVSILAVCSATSPPGSPAPRSLRLLRRSWPPSRSAPRTPWPSSTTRTTQRQAGHSTLDSVPASAPAHLPAACASSVRGASTQLGVLCTHAAAAGHADPARQRRTAHLPRHGPRIPALTLAIRTACPPGPLPCRSCACLRR